MFSARFFNRAGLPLAFAGLACLSMSAVAHEESAAAAAPAAAVAEMDSAANMVVVKDAETGQLRAPTPEEVNALQSPASTRARISAQRTVASQPLQKFHSNGARGARMTPDSMSFTVAVRQADGSFAMRCFDSRQEAESAMGQAPAGKPSNAATE